MAYNQKDWLAHCEQIANATQVNINESPAQFRAAKARMLADYDYFCQTLFPHYTTCESPWYATFGAQLLKQHRFINLMNVIFRGGSKSSHFACMVPLWLKFNGESQAMVLSSDNNDKACMLLGELQAELEANNLLIHYFGQQQAQGSWEEGNFRTRDGFSAWALGLGQSPRGLKSRGVRPDLIVADDVDNKKRCKNPQLIREATDWIEEDLKGTFGTFAERFVFNNNLISRNSITQKLHDKFLLEGKVEKHPGQRLNKGGSVYKVNGKWRYVQVDAVDDNGEPTWPAKYTADYWHNKRKGMSLHSWRREYMNDPVEEGTIFQERWINWKDALPLIEYERIVAYCDPSFKSNAHSDYKAIKVWGKKGTELHLLKAFVRQCSISEMVRWFYDLHESLPKNVLCEYWIEANFLQDLNLDEFHRQGEQRGYQLPIRPDKRAKPDKFSRIESLSPLYENGYITFNAKERNTSDMQRAIEQLLAFEHGSKAADDSPDADEGAIWLLQQGGRVSGFQRVSGKTKRRNY